MGASQNPGAPLKGRPGTVADIMWYVYRDSYFRKLLSEDGLAPKASRIVEKPEEFLGLRGPELTSMADRRRLRADRFE